MHKITILITNDDSIYAPGIQALTEAMLDIADAIYVVAPDKPCSGMGHAITMASPLRISPYVGFKDPKIKAFSTTGTPADCVKLAATVILRDRKPDICLSGINHGSNKSINVLYSGTMSAALEAAIENIPAIGFSLEDTSIEADFTASTHYAKEITQKILRMKKPDYFCVNVNIPKGGVSDISGIKVCHQSYGRYENAFERRTDPNEQHYYWMKGDFITTDKAEDGDVNALAHNYISVVPIQFDMTNYQLFKDLRKIW